MNSQPSIDSRRELSILRHKFFDSLPIAKACSWPGTTWKGTGKDAVLIPCGAPTVGAGLFCDPIHIGCEYHSVCERHKANLNDWSQR